MAKVYEWVDLPVGPQQIPAWAKGLHVWWGDGYANSPDIKIKTDCEAREWPGQVWNFDHRCYWTEHPDGRRREYWHDALSFQEMKFWDMSVREHRATMRWATSQSEGLGGSHVEIFMADGREAVLRGPWCGGAPAGFTGTGYVNTASKWRPVRASKGHYSRSPRYQRRWHQDGGIAGLFIRDDLLLRLVARFQPTLRVARIDGRLEPVREDWDEPKAWMLARQRMAA